LITQIPPLTRETVLSGSGTAASCLYTAFSTPGAFGLDDSPEVRQLIQRHGERTLEGTADIISSREHLRLRSKAHGYVKQYNEHLLRYLREHPKPR
jgi:hypothetical protein